MDDCIGKQRNLAKKKKYVSGNVIIIGFFGIKVVVLES